MIDFLKDLITEKTHQMEELIKAIDLEKISGEGKARLHKLFQELPAESKDKTLNWIERVQTIKADTSLSTTEKYIRIEGLDTGEVIVSLMKSFLTIVIEDIPLKNKDFLMTGLIGAGTFLTALRFKKTAAAAVVASRGLPALLLSPASDRFLEFLKKQLSEKKVS